MGNERNKYVLVAECQRKVDTNKDPKRKTIRTIVLSYAPTEDTESGEVKNDGFCMVHNLGTYNINAQDDCRSLSVIVKVDRFDSDEDKQSAIEIAQRKFQEFKELLSKEGLPGKFQTSEEDIK